MRSERTIIGYIHVCQRTGWTMIFDMLMRRIRDSRLYDALKSIRISVVCDNGFEDDPRFHDPKMVIIYKGRSEEYERPTLLLIKKQSADDPDDTLYFYLHTKGLRHIGTEQEGNVIDWIKLMLYWNVDCWKTAVEVVSNDCYWTYGCNHTGIHYSGNFWWSKHSHIQRLSDHIPDYYTAPEDWVTMLYFGQMTVPIHPEYFNVFSSGLQGMGHYTNPYPESNYTFRNQTEG